MAIIRSYTSTDLGSLYAIAVATGDSGSDASREFRYLELLGHVYAAPYAIFEPELALVIEDQHGVAGYCVGALQTRAFEPLLNLRWWPALQKRYPLCPLSGSGWRSAADDAIIQLIHHPPRSPYWPAEDYPSHLHINLLPRLKGQGHGRRLLTAWHERSRAMGSTGFHLGVDPRNTLAIGFYQAMGLDRLLPATTTAPDDVIWFGARDLHR
ncbi:GNAT family N-acetyltransferase [Sphingomonas sp. PAMC 26617]|uniref:GNAT family N-acetyltransferase n=1 Tax=Sphingomonas sp. PAMC 26617 TaxID=1112216 RepID=UPI00028A157E|nr:GNAT family N-acetyltransferase [Sphingomonas sp. PAMC 26617]